MQYFIFKSETNKMREKRPWRERKTWSNNLQEFLHRKDL